LAADPASAQLFFKDGQPLTATDHYSNPDAARLLERLARDNSVEAFYRGDIAEQIAAAFAKNGGLVTKADLAAYKAREVQPLSFSWNDWELHTAPLTAGGTTIVEALALLKDLKWAERSATEGVPYQVEAFRYAWQDRLELLGDPEWANLPLNRLLDPATIRSAAAKIDKAVADKRPLPVRVTSRPDQGTINLSAADKQGNFVALTLTHGGAFGARVTVPGLGLTLGHGMSRFDPHPGHPNAPGPHKRPLHNMCPTIVTHGGVPVAAIGARGGRRIPNAVAEVLLQLVARGKDLKAAVAAPRMHTEGTLAVSFERAWPAEQTEELKSRGYEVTTGSSATVSAVGKAADSGTFVAAMR
jgi:gamma-glutamyltranspeptidase/glutathione hydrolase